MTNGKNAATAKRGCTPTDIEIGKRIRSLRIEHGMGQTELARKLGVSFQQVQKYEKGANRIAPRRLEIVAATFGRPVTVFFPSMDGKNGAPDKLFDVQSRQEKRLLDLFRKINPVSRNFVLRYIETALNLTPQTRR
jgi:transcriptional regulator with XRE-family HTH domain